MTTEEYNEALADIELARTVGDDAREDQLNWALWEKSVKSIKTLKAADLT